MTPGDRLGGAGQVYVTLAAAKRYAELEKFGDRLEEARRDLTALLLDARLVRPAEADDKPSHWRLRSRTTGIDLSATIVEEPPLLIVLSVNVRDLAPRRRIVGRSGNTT